MNKPWNRSPRNRSPQDSFTDYIWFLEALEKARLHAQRAAARLHAGKCPFPACWRAVLVSLFCVLARCLGVSCRHAGALSWCLEFPACCRAAPASFRRLYRVSNGARKSAPARRKGSSAPARRKMPLSCALARCPGVPSSLLGIALRRRHLVNAPSGSG